MLVVHTVDRRPVSAPVEPRERGHVRVAEPVQKPRAPTQRAAAMRTVPITWPVSCWQKRKARSPYFHDSRQWMEERPARKAPSDRLRRAPAPPPARTSSAVPDNSLGSRTGGRRPKARELRQHRVDSRRFRRSRMLARARWQTAASGYEPRSVGRRSEELHARYAVGTLKWLAALSMLIGDLEGALRSSRRFDEELPDECLAAGAATRPLTGSRLPYRRAVPRPSLRLLACGDVARGAHAGRSLIAAAPRPRGAVAATSSSAAA